MNATDLKAHVKRSVPPRLKRLYRRHAASVEAVIDRYRVGEIDLARTLIGGYSRFDAGRWAEVTGDPRSASALLADSPHVRFLELYREIGEQVFAPEHFEQTPYFRKAMQCIRFTGHYFGHTTREGVASQARSFVTLYERVGRGDQEEVRFEKQGEHSAKGSLPVVHRTWTASTYQIVHGHHRLAIAWVLGQRRVRAVVLPPRPTELQRLALSVSQTKRLRELYQPIDSPEFDGTWRLTRRCHDRLEMMLRFLAERGLAVDGRLDGRSAVDLACSYGWFVSELGKRGCRAMGVEADAAAIRMGRIAYGLDEGQVVQSYLQAFVNETERRFDVVLCLSILHHFALNPGICRPEELLRKIDSITGSVLFVDFGQAHEEWFRESLPHWNDQYLVEMIKANTSFSEVVKLGVDSDDVGPYRDNYRRSLFACVRSRQP